MATDKVSQSPEGNIQHGQHYIDHGTAHIEGATNWVDAMSASYNTLGPVYQPVVDQWHTDTKHKALGAHTSYGNYCITYGQNSVGTGHAFDNAEQDNANFVSSINTEGAAGIPTADGELT